jgi:hypothetical protein
MAATAKTEKVEKNDSIYDNRSISALKGADRVRKRPAVIFGSDGLEGCEHSVFEILSNAVDEAREGYGDTITTTVYLDHSIQIEDHGRGVPLGYNEREGRYNWELIYCELYAGGKYDNNSDGSSYEYSLGLNGLGACATQYSSEYMDVKSYNGKSLFEISFRKGEPVTELTETPLGRGQKRTGTIVRWKPDIEVFTDINIPEEYYSEMLRKQSVVNSGVHFVLLIEREGGEFERSEYYYENGIIDYVAELAGENTLTAPVIWRTETVGRDREDKRDYKLKVEVAFCASNTKKIIEYYHNSSFLEHGGSPDKAVRNAFVYAVDKYLRANGKYNKNESKITFPDVEDCLVLVTNSFSTETSYANQTKKAITNTFIAEAMTKFLRHQLEVYFAEQPMEADRFTAQVLVNKRSREKAETTRLDLKKKLAGNTDISNRVEKFVNCRTKDVSRRELYIVEGDSALTSVKLGRDSEFQAVMPVRGKTLNCQNSSYEKIFKSEVILNLLRVIGCGVEIKTKSKEMVPFDLGALRWNKIIICTDADKDGYHIRTLLLTLFRRLLPTLLREKKVFIAESPLYEIVCKDKSYFAYDEAEKAQILRQLEGQKYKVSRSKGLGENEPEMMRQTTMNPATRRLISVTPADEAETDRIFETLLGDDIAARKAFITEYGPQYMSEIDRSGDDA